MDISSLPSFPPPIPARSDGSPLGNRGTPTPRHSPVLIDLVWLAGIVAVVSWVHETAANIERVRAAERARAAAPPLDFRVVVERFGRVKNGASREEVEHLLGRPTQGTAWGPDVQEVEERLWNGGRNIVPADREWNRWSDPTDPGRWAAVLYIKWGQRPQVYAKLKKGF